MKRLYLFLGLLLAVREDEQAALALGVDSFKYSMLAIAVSAFMTSLAGTFPTSTTSTT